VHFSGWIGKRVWEKLPLTLLDRQVTLRMGGKEWFVGGGSLHVACRPGGWCWAMDHLSGLVMDDGAFVGQYYGEPGQCLPILTIYYVQVEQLQERI
jgi:hypothetical protein